MAGCFIGFFFFKVVELLLTSTKRMITCLWLDQRRVKYTHVLKLTVVSFWIQWMLTIWLSTRLVYLVSFFYSVVFHDIVFMNLYKLIAWLYTDISKRRLFFSKYFLGFYVSFSINKAKVMKNFFCCCYYLDALMFHHCKNSVTKLKH